MEMLNKPGNRSYSSTLKAILLLTFGIYGFMSGCKDSDRTWSAKARSPDGKMIASASTIENGGFGTDFVQTTVYLNWTTGSQSPMEIFAFNDGPAGPGGMNVGMKWLTPTHLELTYNGHQPLFQAVKYYGVDITVQNLSRETINPSQ